MKAFFSLVCTVKTKKKDKNNVSVGRVEKTCLCFLQNMLTFLVEYTDVFFEICRRFVQNMSAILLKYADDFFSGQIVRFEIKSVNLLQILYGMSITVVNDFFFAFFHTIYLAVIIVTIFIVILENRNPVKTMAWILVLFFLPVVGWFLYFFLGRSTRKEKLISKKGYARIAKRPITAFHEQDLHALSRVNRMGDFFYRIGGSLLFSGNKVEFYTDGYSMLHGLMRAIAGAKHHIHLEFYIFENDPVGRLLRDLLIDKAREGVKVRLLYDDVGCWKVDPMFYDEMLCEGIEVQSFLKVRFPRFTSKMNYRNHRKIVVIDGREGFIGGMNIAQRYVKGVSWGRWRDTHVRITGKGVYGLQTAFLTDWYAIDRTMLTSPEYFPKLDVYGNAIVQAVTSHPVGEWHEMMQGVILALTRARHYFYVQSPYFLPTEEVMNAFQLAALSGVDVRVMLPKRGDSYVTHKGSLSYLDDLMKAGVKVYLYRHGFLHSKMFVSDDEIASVGSTNMDFRSFEHNFEANEFFYDMLSVQQLKDIFLADQKESLLLTHKIWEKRSWQNKVVESVVRLLAPLL